MEWEWEALRHYEKLVTAAASLCAPGGMLFVASCTFSIGLPAPFSSGAGTPQKRTKNMGGLCVMVITLPPRSSPTYAISKPC